MSTLTFTAHITVGGEVLRPEVTVTVTPDPPAASVVVDITSPRSILTHAVGIGVSTYGANALWSAAQRDAEYALDARYVRIPVGWRNGRVTSSAAGGPTTLDVPALVGLYRSWGYRVIAVIGGRTNDTDVGPGDALRIVDAIGVDGVDYSAPNEPNNRGLSIGATIDIARRIVAEVKPTHPAFRLGGPVWAWNDIGAVRAFTDALGADMGVADWHRYAMGVSWLPTSEAMTQTPQWGQDVAAIRATHPAIRPVIDELNLSWRYEDGTPPDGRNERFFSAVNTVWCASVLGHVAQAGGAGLVYANQNGPLGVMIEAGNHDRGRPGSSPMPAYWGIAAWTGARMFPHMGAEMYPVGHAGDVEVFAVSNESGGVNVVLINKSETQPATETVSVPGLTPQSVWVTDPTAPFDPPTRTDGRAVNLPPMSVGVSVWG